MRNFGLALVLACVLAGTALAGEVPTTGATAPQPPPPSSIVTTGEIHTTEALADGVPSTGGETVLTVILTLISSVR